MTVEEIASLVAADVARLYTHLNVFREEVYALGYAQGYDDAEAGKPPAMEEE